LWVVNLVAIGVVLSGGDAVRHFLVCIPCLWWELGCMSSMGECGHSSAVTGVVETVDGISVGHCMSSFSKELGRSRTFAIHLCGMVVASVKLASLLA